MLILTPPNINTNEESENIVLHFGTQPHEIDAKTLLESFGAFETALMGISKHGHPEARLSIKVKPFQNGSFEVPIEVHQILLATGLTLSSIDWASAKETVKIFLEIIKLKLELKGKEPKVVSKNGHTVEIQNNSQSTIFVDQRAVNIYVKDSNVGEAISRGFKALETDKEVQSFTVLNKQRDKLLEIQKDSFGYLSAPTKEMADSAHKEIEQLHLPIFKVVFDAGYKWEFFYRGAKKIAATIADEDFLKRVEKGERFGRGDTLIVDLEIVKKPDEKSHILINKSYKITRVYDIQRRAEQTVFPTA